MTDLFKTPSVTHDAPCEGSVQVVMDPSFEGTTPQILPTHRTSYQSVSNLHRGGNANHRSHRGED